MTPSLTHLIDRLDSELQVALFSDYCPNGLQVEGRDRVATLVTGVSASQALIDEAIALKADLLLVHHGFFWKGEAQPITGIKRKRIKALMDHDISLAAYHLPLDAHPQLGNNAQLARLLGVQGATPLDPNDTRCLVWRGALKEPCSAQELVRLLAAKLGRSPQLIEGGDHPVRQLAWCTGAAQSYIDQAAAAGVDAFISGEISEPTVHNAREMGIHYFGAGHHATERYGVKALGEWLAEEEGLVHHFVDINNPV
ncbi:Nif3-like dinuclear metal center hexameric protein [Aestuariirhabdus litorea]|uniref:GTP cyclohydrolase 1 type 2 homolog n=1 Tax=Aestuariirhabdus litorea TaxID=2528527 RepID=A0A3P3VPY9_9GAMM|nr:Nif3-like dinuclear metal center hexameric protein [Aestuariirhabdus litorea]RRJ83736.1 Nif3-like dinuclear metal center hexameric protein [Aestuariirhabdus litorea]RWW96959.1 Nif3-like dinuclear metal center hexameric protein [Endozoicomonadaceae bacterium GTF-13]